MNGGGENPLRSKRVLDLLQEQELEPENPGRNRIRKNRAEMHGFFVAFMGRKRTHPRQNLSM